MDKLLEEQQDIIFRLKQLGQAWVIIGGVRLRNPNLEVENRLIKILQNRYEKNREAIESGYNELKR